MRMELSYAMPNLAQFNALKKQQDGPQSHILSQTSQSSTSSGSQSQAQVVPEEDTIDIAQINLDDEEAWLYNCERKSDTNLYKWLYNVDDFDLEDAETPEAQTEEFRQQKESPLPPQRLKKLNRSNVSSNNSSNDNNGSINDKRDESPSPKSIDTRTFTRPKRRLVRPSIEQYNEELYGSALSDSQSDTNSTKDAAPVTISQSGNRRLSDSGVFVNGGSSQENSESTPTKPLHFDLTQSTTSHYFENILMGASTSNIDSFQNMSPPSLVNSMCSSTFANLMESSFIKNDPKKERNEMRTVPTNSQGQNVIDKVLREIRDTDYTESILLHEPDPMCQSITESCSSLNSDVPENFLKKVSFTPGGGNNSSHSNNSSNNDTFRRHSFVKTADATFTREDFLSDENSSPQLNATTTIAENGSNNTSDDVIVMNGTYRRSTPSKQLKTTFRKVDSIATAHANAQQQKVLNATYRNSSVGSSGSGGSPETALNATVTLQKTTVSSSLPSHPADLNATITLTGSPQSQKFEAQQDVQLLSESPPQRPPRSSEKQQPQQQQPKRLLDRRERLMQEFTHSNDQLNVTFDASNDDGSSTENLDYVSISSNASSSQGSSSTKMLSMEGINAIVEMQERSLQVMSTPKPQYPSGPSHRQHLLWTDHHTLSPIDSHSSNPDLVSSNLLIAETESPKSSINRNNPDQPNQHEAIMISPATLRKQKSLGHLHSNNRHGVQTRPVHPESNLMTTGVSRLQGMAGNIRVDFEGSNSQFGAAKGFFKKDSENSLTGSYPSLKSTTASRPQQSNLIRPSSTAANRQPQGQQKTNLNSMGRTLKGSYTSLKPISANLPVAPPPLNTTQTLVKSKNQVAKVQPIPRETAPAHYGSRPEDNHTFVKPKQPPTVAPARSSGLPRPVGGGGASTGIPRPMSRIPGPRPTRSVAKPVGQQQGKQSMY